MNRTYRTMNTQGNSTDTESYVGVVSQTVPDQTYTVREILLKFASGQKLPLANEPYYSEDLPDLRGLDPSEVFQMAIDQKNHVNDLYKKGYDENVLFNAEKKKIIDAQKVQEVNIIPDELVS